MTSLPSPAWLRTFETAARLGGFAAAAEELRLTPAAVSQQIRSLEGRLGFQLFRRLPRGVALSEMGRAYLPSVRRAFEDLESATAGLFGIGQPRLLVVRAPISFATLRLAPVLGEFRAAHPAVSLRLCTSVWAEGVDDDLIDIDVRYGDGRWPAAEIRRLTAPVSVPVCPPGTEFGADPLSVVAEIAAGQAIHITGCESFWQSLARQHGMDEGQIGAALSADSSIVALEMVAAGLGAAVIARDLAVGHLSAGRVAAPPGIMLEHDQAHHVVLPQNRAGRPDVLLFRNWLTERFSESGT